MDKCNASEKTKFSSFNLRDKQIKPCNHNGSHVLAQGDTCDYMDKCNASEKTKFSSFNLRRLIL